MKNYKKTAMAAALFVTMFVAYANAVIKVVANEGSTVEQPLVTFHGHTSM